MPHALSNSHAHAHFLVPICTNCNNFCLQALCNASEYPGCGWCEGQSIFKSCHIKLKSFAMFNQFSKRASISSANILYEYSFLLFLPYLYHIIQMSHNIKIMKMSDILQTLLKGHPVYLRIVFSFKQFFRTLGLHQN